MKLIFQTKIEDVKKIIVTFFSVSESELDSSEELDFLDFFFFFFFFLVLSLSPESSSEDDRA